MGGIKLRHYQQTSVEGIRHAYRHNKKAPLLVLPTGAGKCLAYGTKVLMYDGSIKTVENVEVGDIIMGPDSTPRNVLSLARGAEEMYRITLKNNDAFTCNASHILSLVCNANHSAKFRKDQVYNLSVKEYLALPKSVKHILKAYKSRVEFDHKETGIPPYLLGVWLGDGDSKAFTITTMDKPIVDYILQYASNNQMGVNDAPNGETKARRYSLTSSVRGWGNGLTGFLSKHNLTNNKHIPQRYLINSRKNRLELLAGIIDTDGHYHNNCYEVFVMHEQLANDVMFLCRSLGFSVTHSNKHGVQGKRISISGEGLEEIPVLLERKKAHKRMQIKNALRYGFSVVYAGIGDYYGFEIDGDRLFMLGDFTVTHNTVVFTYIAHSSASKGNRVLILVHRVELLRQTSAALLKFGVHHGLINPNFTPDRHASTQVASVQTLIKRLHTIAPPDLIIVDECFPAGTIIDGKPIEHIKKGDFVRSFSHSHAQVQKRFVISTSERTYKGDWYRLTFSDGSSLVSTENHTYYSSTHGYVSAVDIFSNAPLFCNNMDCIFVSYGKGYMPTMQIGNGANKVEPEKEILQRKMLWSLPKINYSKFGVASTILQRMWKILFNENKTKAFRGCKNKQGILFGNMQKGVCEKNFICDCKQNQQDLCFGSNEKEKSNVQRGFKEKNDGINGWQNIFKSWWKWRTNKATNKTNGSDKTITGVSDFSCSCKKEIREPSELLQGRFSLSRSQVSNRSGWKNTPIEEMEVFGQKEGGCVEGVRLVSIEVYKRGSGQQPEWVPKSDIVYNFGVDGNHNYFANGILVHNCHHALAQTWRTIIGHFPNAKVLGVTATPCRGDGSGLGVEAGGLFDEIIIGPQIGDLIKEGYLVKPVIYAPKDRLDLTSVRVKMGDYVSKDLANVVDKPSITGNAVEHYTRICPGTPCVVFCVNVMHAQHVAEEFRAAGYRAFHADGTMEDEERKRILNGLGNGYAQVVTSCDLISEGTDIPAIGCAILLRPTKSTGLYLQQVGRALRPCEGKERAIILDHVGNVLTHGMPDEPREWTLDGDMKRKKKKKVDADAPKVLQCPSCYAMHEPALSCPLCGHVRPVKQRDLKKVDGELREITETEQYIFRKQKNMEVGRAQTLEELTAIGNARGYKPGWAIAMYKAKQAKRVIKVTP